MKKTVLFSLLILVFAALNSCSSSNADSQFVKKWVLISVSGATPDQDKILGIDNIYFDLRDDESMDARWYDQNSDTEFEDMKGRWMTTKVGEEGYDLFLFYGPGSKKTKIFTIKKVTERQMIMTISGIDHIFEAK